MRLSDLHNISRIVNFDEYIGLSCVNVITTDNNVNFFLFVINSKKREKLIGKHFYGTHRWLYLHNIKKKAFFIVKFYKLKMKK